MEQDWTHQNQASDNGSSRTTEKYIFSTAALQIFLAAYDTYGHIALFGFYELVWSGHFILLLSYEWEFISSTAEYGPPE